MQTRCPHCRAEADVPETPGTWIHCPACGSAFRPRPEKAPRRARTDDEPEEEAGDDEEGGRPRRGRRRRGDRPVRTGLWYDWKDPAGRMRNARTIGGFLVVVLALGFFLYLRVIAPLSATLSLDVEVKAQAEVSVDVSHSHDFAWGGRRSPNEWKIDLVVRVKNRTGKALTVGRVTVAFYDEDGDEIPLRGTSLNQLMPESLAETGLGLLGPGETATFKTLLPLRIRAGGGETRVLAEVRVADVKSYDREFAERFQKE